MKPWLGSCGDGLLYGTRLETIHSLSRSTITIPSKYTSSPEKYTVNLKCDNGCLDL